MELAIAALAAYVLLVLNPEAICALAPGGHPGTTSVRLLYVSDYPGARPRAYWSRPRCSRCDRLIDDLSPATRSGGVGAPLDPASSPSVQVASRQVSRAPRAAARVETSSEV